MPDRSLDHPDLRPDQCRVSLVVGTDMLPIRISRLKAHCLQPVADDVWQLCELHHGERVRLVAKYGEAS